MKLTPARSQIPSTTRPFPSHRSVPHFMTLRYPETSLVAHKSLPAPSGSISHREEACFLLQEEWGLMGGETSYVCLVNTLLRSTFFLATPQQSSRYVTLCSRTGRAHN